MKKYAGKIKTASKTLSARKGHGCRRRFLSGFKFLIISFGKAHEFRELFVEK